MKEFLKLYADVFEEDGSIKICTREKTIALIEKAQELKTGVDFGNTDTGYMQVDAIKNLRDTFDI